MPCGPCRRVVDDVCARPLSLWWMACAGASLLSVPHGHRHVRLLAAKEAGVAGRPCSRGRHTPLVWRHDESCRLPRLSVEKPERGVCARVCVNRRLSWRVVSCWSIAAKVWSSITSGWCGRFGVGLAGCREEMRLNVAQVRKEMRLGGVYGAKSVPVVMPRRKELRRRMAPHRRGGVPH